MIYSSIFKSCLPNLQLAAVCVNCVYTIKKIHNNLLLIFDVRPTEQRTIICVSAC